MKRYLMNPTLLGLMLVALAELPGATPRHDLAAAVRDVSTNVTASERTHTRYLSLSAVPGDQRKEAVAAVSLVLNSVSRSSRIVRPQPVEGTDGRLLRFSLRRYKLPSEVWEAMVAGDPYWHIRTKVVDPRSGKTREVFSDGGWVDLEKAAKLRNLTGSGGALVRADWFVAKAATSSSGGFYYQLAGVPSREEDFFKQLGVDLKTNEKLRADRGANMFKSRVTGKVRRVIRRQGPLGAIWTTLDVERSTPERDPFRNPLDFKYDAGEHIAVKPNGLHLFALYDAKGDRAGTVPDRIAKDTSDPHGDGIIAAMISCVRCHREDGLRPVVNDQRRLLSANVDLLAEDDEVAERLATFYDTSLGKELRRDREDYAENVARATGGMRVEQASEALGQLFRSYVYQRVTPRQAACELGIPAGRLPPLLAVSHDPILLALCEGISVQREQWEASFAEAATLAAAIVRQASTKASVGK
ncbi:MAG: hypothetical protein IIA67_12630 [Planctomycetes bacterium]|nr:hypothetical protein [Planctomycetota bacterium]